MERKKLELEQIEAFAQYLHMEEREQSTIEKYQRDMRSFAIWTGDREVNKSLTVAWRIHLKAQGCKPETINGKLSALNKFLRFIGWEEYQVKLLRVQRRLFRGVERNLTKDEYLRLVDTAVGMGRARLALLMETICATGIRVSEVRYITVEAIRIGYVEIAQKGKIRTILMPSKLCRKLEKYAKKQKIASGELFVTRSGKGLTRRQIWAEMKAICKAADVKASKVFPHNLRHLFARTFYHVSRDIARLADVLGHSSIETTRIYLISTGVEHAQQLNRLGLVS